uniref:3Beta_HSD domain-containing protein n=1 Tax=Heterorhabditis bacteriophora TaxID=37862 RepID=A0A1I7XUT7_HETBA
MFLLLVLSGYYTSCISSSITLSPSTDSARDFNTIRVLVACNFTCIEQCEVTINSFWKKYRCSKCLNSCYHSEKLLEMDKIPEDSGLLSFLTVCCANNDSSHNVTIQLDFGVNKLLNNAYAVLEYRIIDNSYSNLPSQWLVSQITKNSSLSLRGLIRSSLYQFRVTLLRGFTILDRRTSSWLAFNESFNGVHTWFLLRVLQVDPVKCLDSQGLLELVEADLMDADCWQKYTKFTIIQNIVVSSCDYIFHVASPFPIVADETCIDTAITGTINVLKAANKEKTVRKVVLTSSCAAVNEGHPQDKVFDETSWTDVNSKSVEYYAKSKTLAEKAAWDYVNQIKDGNK